MTIGDHPRLDQLAFAIHDGDTASGELQVVRQLYAEVFAEPPYYEDAAEVDRFVAGWSRLFDQPGFRLVVAKRAHQPIGFTFGLQLLEQTQWWEGAVTPLPGEITTEWAARTFAIIELAVRLPYRRRGVARELHAQLVAGRTEERVTLLVRPDALAAQRAYLAWGYAKVGRVRPFPDGPVYDAMLQALGRNPGMSKRS